MKLFFDICMMFGVAAMAAVLLLAAIHGIIALTDKNNKNEP